MRALMGARIAQVWLDDANRRPAKPRRTRRRPRGTLSAVLALTTVAGMLAAVQAHAAFY